MAMNRIVEHFEYETHQIRTENWKQIGGEECRNGSSRRYSAELATLLL